MENHTTSQPLLRPSKMFKYGTFSKIFLGTGGGGKGGGTKVAGAGTGTDQEVSGQQQQGETTTTSSSSTDPGAPPPANKKSRSARLSLIAMLATAGVLLAVGLLAGLLTKHRAAAAPGPGEDTPRLNSSGRPNIVMIMTDDQDRRLGSTDHMANLHRRLVDRGTEFTNHYTTQALCCPARSSFLRGQQVHNTNITNVVKPGYVHMCDDLDLSAPVLAVRGRARERKEGEKTS